MVEKARKIRKTKKVSKAPLYALIIAVIIIFSLLGAGLYYSVGSVSPNLIVMLVVVVAVTIVLELMLKRNIFRGYEAMRDDENHAPNGLESEPVKDSKDETQE